MKLEEIQWAQPELVERFTQILNTNSSVMLIFTGFFASIEIALLLAQSQFGEDFRSFGPLWQMPFLSLDC